MRALEPPGAGENVLAQCHKRNKQDLTTSFADGRTCTSEQDTQGEQSKQDVHECSRNEYLYLADRTQARMQGLL